MALEGVKVGPLDPDRTAEFGQVSAKNSARTLLRFHAQQNPAVLRQRLARAIDPERTKGLDMDEVRAYVGGLKHDNGDPLVPDGATVVGASVRGETDREQTLTFTYELPSGRTGKWFAPYTASAIPRSFESGAQYARIREMKDRGVVEFDREGLHTHVLERENAGLRREVKALRGNLESPDEQAEDVEETPGDTRPDDKIAEENQRLGQENEELRSRLAALEAHFGNAPGDADQAEATATEEPPLDDYDGYKADELVKLMRSDDTDADTRQKVLDYERRHQNRRTVVAAAEESLGKGD